MNRFLNSRTAIDIFRGFVSLTIVAAALAFVIWKGGGDRPRVDVPQADTVVEVMRAVPHQDDFEFEVDGVVVPYREIDVAAEVAGRVVYKSPSCRAGEPIREGDLLFRIDSTEYQLEVDRLTELVEQAEGSVDELEVEMESAAQQIQFAEEDLQIRQRELSRYQGAGFSKAEVDVAKRNELMARDTLQARKDQLQLLKARKRRTLSAEASARTQLAKAKLDLKRCEVRSRISGVIVTESVQQESFVAKGGVLVVIRDTSKMEVRCNLQMQQMQWLWESASHPASVSATSRLSTSPSPSKGELEVEAPTAAPETDSPTTTRTQRAYRFPTSAAKVLYELDGVRYSWDAQLTRYANSSVDNRTRMVPCIAEVLDPEKVVRADDGSISDAAPPTLLSGMFVTLRVRLDLARNLLKLPVTAVGPSGDVWYVDDQRHIHRTRGKVLHADRDSVLVEQTTALKDALIITSPLVSPKEGDLVTLADDADHADDESAVAGQPLGSKGRPTSAPATAVPKSAPEEPNAPPATVPSPAEATS